MALSKIPTGIYILNAMPFRVVPDQISFVRLNEALHKHQQTIDLSQAGIFVERTNELWSFVPLSILGSILNQIADLETSSVISRDRVEANADTKRVLSWLLRKHWERYLVTNFSDCGLILEPGRKHRAYFGGNNKQTRTIVWNLSLIHI